MSTSKTKRILAFTSTRSDYDLLSYVYKELSTDQECELQLIVSGMHLSKTYGYSYQEIEKDNLKILSTIETLIDSDSRGARIKTASLLMQNSIHDIVKFDPDLILFAGDREDALVAATLASYLSIPSIHFFGGDHTTDGNVDNPVRHACSKLATAHFVMCEEHKNRLIALGESPQRIFNIGSPSIDKLVHEAQKSKKEIFDHLGLAHLIDKKYAVVIFHPIIGDEDIAGKQFVDIIDPLLEKGFSVLCGTPNVDSGNKLILQEIAEYSKTQPNFFSYKNLDRKTFVNLLRRCDLLIGNSSAGILEAASLKIRVINVGRRQVGRMHGGNVIFCDSTREGVSDALSKAFTKDYEALVTKVENPYGSGDASQKAVDLLKKIDFKKMVSKKEDPLSERK